MNNRYFSLMLLGWVGVNLLLIFFNLIRLVFESFKHTSLEGNTDALESIDRLKESLKNINKQ